MGLTWAAQGPGVGGLLICHLPCVLGQVTSLSWASQLQSGHNRSTELGAQALLFMAISTHSVLCLCALSHVPWIQLKPTEAFSTAMTPEGLPPNPPSQRCTKQDSVHRVESRSAGFKKAELNSQPWHCWPLGSGNSLRWGLSCALSLYLLHAMSTPRAGGSKMPSVGNHWHGRPLRGA